LGINGAVRLTGPAKRDLAGLMEWTVYLSPKHARHSVVGEFGFALELEGTPAENT
jgi:hypothetical protein